VRRVEVRLYVAGESPNSVTAIRNLRALLEELPRGEAKLEIIDVLEEPERALRDGVLVTPTMMRVAPPPERRVIGDLRERSVVSSLLGFREGPSDG
jgi:circadian clock protein KaiB